jgi:hypothetical protein
MKDIKEQISELRAIESDFLKVIKSGISHCQMVDDSDPIIITGEETVATELAGKVERFMEWVGMETSCGKKDFWQVYDNALHIIAIYSLSDLYSYWLKEIDTKK